MSEDFSQALTRCLGYFKDSYAHFTRNLAPTLRLVTPYAALVLLMSILGGVMGAMAGATMQVSGGSDMGSMALAGILGLVFLVVVLAMIPIGLFYFFCQTRFVVNTFSKDMTNATLGELWAFDNSFWGFLGLMIVLFLLSIPVSIAGGIGLLLLIVPGVLIFSLLMIYSANCYFAYLQNPAAGLGDALGKGWELIQSNWTRWLALAAITGGVYFVAYVLYFLVVLTISAILAMMMLSFVGDIIAQFLQIIFMFVTIYMLYVYFQCYRDTIADSLTA